jgi:hypothetical protein
MTADPTNWHEADDMPVRWQARTLGVYRTAIFTWTEEADGRYRAQGYVFLARSGRWSRLMFDTNRSPPRLTRAEAEADFKAQRCLATNLLNPERNPRP